jgi:hypothetical protein
MGIFRFFSKTVSAAFIDDATGERFAAFEVSVDQLPETVALETQLHWSGGSYQ